MITSLEDWNPWWNKTNPTVPDDLKGTERNILFEIIPFLSLNKIITLVGVRRSGKSTVLYQIIAYLLDNNIARPEEILFINFEDIRFKAQSIEDWFKLYLEELRPSRIPFLFLDEIHNCQDWVGFIRSLFDRKKAKFFLSDSSSYLIPRELETILTGRKVTFEVFPLSFKEYLMFKKIEIKIHGTQDRSLIRGYLKTYLHQGGFPELINTLNWKVSKKVLLEFFDDIILKDVVARFGVDNEKIKNFSFFLLSNPTQKISFRKLQSTLHLGTNIPQKYLQHLEEVFFCFTLHSYSIKVREQIRSPKKIYPIDVGLVNAVSFQLTQNLGPLLEQVIFLELRRRRLDIYYKDLVNVKHEIDFVIREENKITTIINVSYDLKNKSTRLREVEGLKQGIIELSPLNSFLITWSEESKITIKESRSTKKESSNIIRIIPAWKWLLDL